MRIIISYESGVPIYEQIKIQLRGDILRGNISEGTMLPSIRMLAKELKIGIITAKRAYDDLCAEGFLYSVPGKGVFVAAFDRDKAEEYALNEIREKLISVLEYAKHNSVDNSKVKKIINEILGE